METKRADQPNVNRMTFKGLFRVKPLDAILEDAEQPEHQLKRALGPLQLTLFGIGAGMPLLARLRLATPTVLAPESISCCWRGKRRNDI